MNKKYIIRKNLEIKKIVSNSKKIVTNLYVIYYNSNKLNYNRYCISVSKKIGNAVTRNLYKRRVKDILMKNNINSSCDYVIILRTAILDVNYKLMENNLLNILKGEK